MGSDNLARGIRGVLATGGSVAVSLSNFEQWLRIGSLIIGITVGIATLISILRNMPKK